MTKLSGVAESEIFRKSRRVDAGIINFISPKSSERVSFIIASRWVFVAAIVTEVPLTSKQHPVKIGRESSEAQAKAVLRIKFFSVEVFILNELKAS